MGSSGGIKITEISEIRSNWKTIRNSLIELTERDFKHSEFYNESSTFELFEKTNNLPKNIDKLTDEQICKELTIFSSCDCPTLYKGAIITADGDYVEKRMLLLSLVLPGVSVETWT